MSRQIDDIVNNVNAQLDAPDKKAEQKAYQLLADEVHHFSVTHSDKEAQQFTTDVINTLEKQGSLPSLSVGWARANYKEINADRDEGLSQGEIARYTKDASTPQALLSSVLADSMLHRNADGSSVFSDVAHRSPNSISDDLIEKSDLRAFGRQERREERREEKHDAVKDDAARLFEGKPCLMEVLDASGNGKIDGRVSERDMRRFLVAYQVNENGPSAQQYPYTKDNAMFVQDLLDGKYPHITGPNFTGFSAEALSRRAGLDHLIVRDPSDYDTLVSNYRRVSGQPVEQQPPAGKDQTPPPAKQDDSAEAQRAAEAARQLKLEQQAVKMTDAQIEDMTTVRKSEGYWHVSKRLLNAGFQGEHGASDQDINKLTRMLVQDNQSIIAKDGMARPMVHPGQAISHEHLFEMSQKIPRLSQSLDRLYQQNRAKVEGEKVQGDKVKGDNVKGDNTEDE